MINDTSKVLNSTQNTQLDLIDKLILLQNTEGVSDTVFGERYGSSRVGWNRIKNRNLQPSQRFLICVLVNNQGLTNDVLFYLRSRFTNVNNKLKTANNQFRKDNGKIPVSNK